MLIKWLLIPLLIPAIAELKALWNVDDSSINEETMRKIIEFCDETGGSSNPIIIFGDFPESIEASLVMRMNKFLSIDEAHDSDESLNYQASKIALIGESPEQVKSDLMLIKKTKYWNHMAPLYITRESLKACEDCKDILIAAWRMDIINSICICSQLTNTSALYTLNRMTNYAPHPWKRLDTFDNSNLYHQVFDPKTSCNNLHYDKTQLLNGYNVRVVAVDRSESIDISGHNAALEKSYHLHLRIIHAIMKVLNTNLIFEVESGYDDVAERITSGTSDMGLNFSPMIPHQHEPLQLFLSPYFRTQFIAVVKSSPEMSTLEKIFHIWRTSVLISAAVALAIFFFILVIKNNDVMLAVLDLIRLLTYLTIRTESRSTSFRIFFTTMLIFMVISNGVFQGKISAFLTKRERVRAIETVNEAVKLGYKFYAGAGMGKYARPVCPKCDIIEVPAVWCIDYVLNGTLHACIILKEDYLRKYILLPLEYVREPFAEGYLTQKCRDNWPLHGRVNRLWRRIFESGLFNRWNLESAYYSMQKRRADDVELTSLQPRAIRLVKLKFAIQLLGIGLILGTVSLIFELLFVKYNIG